MRLHDFTFGFLVGFSFFVAANLIAVHIRSDGGLLEGLGIVDNVHDDIRRIGFPFQFFEEGGFSYRRVVSPLAFAGDALVAIVCSAGIAVAHAWMRAGDYHDRAAYPPSK